MGPTQSPDDGRLVRGGRRLAVVDLLLDRAIYPETIRADDGTRA